MTNHYLSDAEITTEGAFDDALSELLVTAHERDVDVEGAWTCRNPPSVPDWDVNVFQLEKPDSA